MTVSYAPFNMGPVRVSLGAPLFLIAGPCVIESEEHAFQMARRIRDTARDAGIPYVFKASYDKANRSSGKAFRGPGLVEGLRVLERIRRELEVPVLTDVHQVEEVAAAAAVVDVLQIPAFLCRQTDLIQAAARSGCVVNLKKGQFLAPWDMRAVLDKFRLAAPAAGVILTERGASFGYNNLVVDMRVFPIMRALGAPVVYDVTHSLQLPGAAGDSSGGMPQYIETLARAGVAAGVDGIFLEVHDDPAHALSDGANALPLARLAGLLRQVKAVDRAVRENPV
ncbi:MAG: 3-deoxy-8-phosphooctulonate synthase [Terriglobales bacterium]